MTADLDLGGNKISNLKSPESDNDAVNREYLNQKISEISDKTNVFAYLNNPNQTISQRNITVNSSGFWNNSPYKYNKRAYHVTLQQHAPPNYYNSIIGFKLNDAGTGKFTLVFEIYTTEISNINISNVTDASTINKETQINLVDHTKLITQVNNPSLQNNDYLYYKITGNSTQATIKTHIIVYGVSGWVDSVDNKIYENIIYYLDNMFEYDYGTKMKTGVNLSNFKISNLKTPTTDTDAVNKKYIDEKLEQSHILASSKKNEFVYLDSPDDTSSEYNIVVNDFVNNFNESPHRNKKAYDITLQKDSGSNNYRSRIGFNLYPQPLGTYTMIFEFFPPEMTNIDLSVQATSAYIHKQVQKNFSSYSKILVQINNNSKQTPDYIYLTMHGTATATPAQGYLIVYGTKDWSDSLNPEIYDHVLTEETFEYDDGDMKMNTDLDMNNHYITHLNDGTDDTDAVNKRQLDVAYTKLKNYRYRSLFKDDFYDLLETGSFVLSRDVTGIVIDGLLPNFNLGTKRFRRNFSPKNGLILSARSHIKLSTTLNQNSSFTFLCNSFTIEARHVKYLFQTLKLV